MNRKDEGPPTAAVGQADAQRDPTSCPYWCAEDPNLPHQVHRAAAGAFRLPALHTRRGRLLRPERGLVQVELHVGDDLAGRRDEECVAVLGSDGAPLDLTNGEARRLARLLIAAADRLDGIP